MVAAEVVNGKDAVKQVTILACFCFLRYSLAHMSGIETTKLIRIKSPRVRGCSDKQGRHTWNSLSCKCRRLQSFKNVDLSNPLLPVLVASYLLASDLYMSDAQLRLRSPGTFTSRRLEDESIAAMAAHHLALVVKLRVSVVPSKTFSCYSVLSIHWF